MHPLDRLFEKILTLAGAAHLAPQLCCRSGSDPDRLDAGAVVADRPCQPRRGGKPATGQAPPAHKAASEDPQNCEYWKYCAIDGYLCSCCGGSSHSCPARHGDVADPRGSAPATIPATNVTTWSRTTIAAVRPAAATANATAMSGKSPSIGCRVTTMSTGAWPTAIRTITARCR